MFLKSGIFILLFAICLAIESPCQKNHPYSKITQENVDSIIAWVNSQRQILKQDTLLHYSYIALSKAQKSGNDSQIGDAHALLTKLHRDYSPYDSILVHAEKAIQYFTKTNEVSKIAESHLNHAYAYGNKLFFLKAEEHLMKAIDIFEKIDDQSQLSRSYSLLGYLFFLSEDNENAIKFGELSTKIAKSINDTLNVIVSLSYNIPAYIANEQYTTALAIADEAIQWLQPFRYKTPTMVLDLYYYRGNALVALGRLQEAMEDYEFANESGEKKNHLEGSQGNIFYTDGIAYIHQLNGEYEKAVSINKRLLDYLNQTGEFENLIRTHFRLAQCYEALGKFPEALQQNQIAWHMQDSIKTLRSKVLASELQIRYETAKQVETITSQQLQIDRQQRIQNLSLGIALFSLILFVVFFYIYRHNQKKNLQLQTLNKTLSENNMLLDEKNAQNQILLKEIHHRVKNNLEIVSSLLELQGAQLQDEQQQKALQSSQGRIQSMGIIHQKLYKENNLSSIEMRDYFMHLAEHIIDAYDAEKYVSFECHMEPIELDLDTAVPVGLIVNELITNALKYAFPNKQKGLIGIQLKPIANECLYLQVTDNGIGKTHSESVGNAGFGSHLILLLAKQLGGKIKEETKNGTKISLTFRWTNLHNE